MGKIIDLTGQKFGFLQVVRISENVKYGHLAAWICLCECGTTKEIVGSSLRRGATKSCGCKAVRWGNQDQLKHGLTKHRLQGTWRAMKERCSNPNHIAYARYGGRGITVCDRWLKIENFVADNDALALPGLSLDRADNDGPYSPENCRWVSRREQSRNRGNNTILTHDGMTMCMSAWAERLGTSCATLVSRLGLGWSVEDTLSRPIRPRMPNRRGRKDPPVP